jgi:flagellar hook-basal body complex protein FliE
MVENYNPIDKSNFIDFQRQTGRTKLPGTDQEGKDFKSLLIDSINEVNKLQNEAEKATVNLATGKTDNIAEVFTAINKAEIAFDTLLQIRNKLMDAYEEIRQMRV